MSTSSQINDLNELLIHHNAKNTGKQSTHTRIGDSELNIYGGNYNIEKENLETFFRLYYDHVFNKKRKEYLTESQLKDGTGPILIDFDFRYAYDVTKRLHTAGHIQDIIQLYLEELKELLVFVKDVKFPIFVMEKPNVNRVTEKNITKDGIHMIIGIQMDHTLQMMLRDRIISKIGDIWSDLPLTNDWQGVLDDGISKGTTNWQMYGSQKPGNEAYKLVHYIVAEMDPVDGEFMTVPKQLKELDLSKDLYLLSAKYDKHVKFEINPNILEQYNKLLSCKTKPKKSSSASGKSKVKLILEEENESVSDIRIEDIKNIDTLTKAVEIILSDLKLNEQYIKETHMYTQILPEKYYQPGSHSLNRQVAFALKHTDERLFLSWVMLRSKASDFDFDTIPQLYNSWKFHFGKREDGVTRRSIMYWAKQDAYDDYEKVKKSTIDSFIEDTIFDVADWDYAMLLYHMFKDKYVCSSITNKTWYIFKDHKWENDEGMTLRMAISKELFQLYSDKQGEYLAEMHEFKDDVAYYEKLGLKVKKIAEICVKLKKTGDKNNIMREAMEIFFDKHFMKNMDSNPYLMCFTNGVIDFKTKTFRGGYPQDYITKTTGIPYIPFNEQESSEISEEIITFMEQLFPQQDLCRYMWDHLAATLIGTKKEHVFNIYRGSGSNGKSILTELMSQALGEYKGTVPITLVTEKRNAIGGTSSEVIQLKGVRYAVMQEPSKDAIINEGIMKELTGGDPIQARALFCASEIFIPQFSLVVCTNALFEIKSNDDGTWRRMKLVDFMSKFVSEGEQHTDDTKYVFVKDKSLKEKLPKWAIVFISMLVKRAFETDGEVVDCEEVKAASNKYRQSQDCFAGFISDKIEQLPGAHVGKRELNLVFKEWFQMNYGNRKAPKLMELEESMDKKFEKKLNKNGSKEWVNIRIRNDDDLDDNVLDTTF